MRASIGIWILPVAILVGTGTANGAPVSTVEGPYVVVADVVHNCRGQGCEIAVTQSPLPGKSKVVSRQEVESALRNADIRSDRYKIPTRKRVNRPGRDESESVLESKYREAILKVLPPGVVIETLGRITKVKVPRGAYTVEAKWPGDDGLRRRVSIPVTLSEDDVPFGKVQIFATLAFRMRLPVAAFDLKEGAMVDGSAFEWAEKTVEERTFRVAKSEEEVVGHTLKRAVSKGDIFELENLERTPIVLRGEQLSVESVQGLVRIRTTGEARQDGAMGERIRILVPVSHRLLWAKITGGGQVTVVP